MKKRCTAVVLAAGQGRRMRSNIQKQYLELCGYPILYYALETFQRSQIIDDIILVVGKGEHVYCEKEIVQKYKFTKVDTIIEGGAERYNSVWNALQVIAEDDMKVSNENGYVFIHDGARPFVTEEIISRGYEGARRYGAAVVGMPSKDTIKIVDEDHKALETPDRNYVWAVQTPQVFETKLIIDAYAKLMEQEEANVTDDAMVLEQMTGHRVKLVEGSYENIKITTPEDLDVARVFIKKATHYLYRDMGSIPTKENKNV